MKNYLNKKRIDTASRFIKAPPQVIYQAFLDPESLAVWLPPKGMSAQIEVFDPQVGGAFKITFTYDSVSSGSGKSSENTDVTQGEFLELIPRSRIVQSIKFDSDKPAFSGEMIQEWCLEEEIEGTRVSVFCENVPEGIREEDHITGLSSTLENLALITE